MSHISTCTTSPEINNEGGIKVAIALMAEECPGITFEQRAPDLIVARYKPIEGYQTKGNLRFVRNAAGIWNMQIDTWLCDSEVHRVKKSFELNYLKAGALDYCKRKRFKANTTKTKTGARIEAQAMW